MIRPLFRLCSLFFLSFTGAYANIYLNDLDTVHHHLKENHPATHYSKFRHYIAAGYKEARTKIEHTTSPALQKNAVKEYADIFERHAVRVDYAPRTTSALFSMEEIAPHVHWVTLPTFAPEGKQQQSFFDLLKKLTSLHRKPGATFKTLTETEKDKIVFDLRGNKGGSSFYAGAILDELFGSHVTNLIRHQLLPRTRPFTVHWRKSKENRAYLEELYNFWKKQLPESDVAKRWLPRTLAGLQEAEKTNKRYYDELRPTDALAEAYPVPQTAAKIIIIMDKSCSNACLDFIQELKAIKHYDSAQCTIIGETTQLETHGRELRTVKLPSGKGSLTYPIKGIKDDPTVNGFPPLHTKPDIKYRRNLCDTAKLQEFVLSLKNRAAKPKKRRTQAVHKPTRRNSAVSRGAQRRN